MKTNGSSDRPTIGSMPSNAATQAVNSRFELLALTPLLVFTDSGAISLGLWLVLCTMAVGGKALCLISLRLSLAVNDSRQAPAALNISTTCCLFFLIYAFWAAIVIAAIDTSHFAFSRALGNYLYLIVCSAYLLAEARSLQDLGLPGNRADDSVASNGSPSTKLDLLLEGKNLLKTLSRYGLLLIGFAMLREALYTGSLMRDWQLLLPFTVSAKHVAIYSRAEQLVPMAGLIPGGFILLGLFIALLRLAGQQLTRQFSLFKPAVTADTVKRARVTEKL